jgi:hypothetical protein
VHAERLEYAYVMRGWLPGDRAVPAVLAGARRELAPVLYTPGALAPFGFDDVG